MSSYLTHLHVVLRHESTEVCCYVMLCWDLEQGTEPDCICIGWLLLNISDYSVLPRRLLSQDSSSDCVQHKVLKVALDGAG